MVTPRQQVAFPDVAIIHKGTPKKIVVKDDRKVEIQGKDLNNKFRIHFLPGTDAVRAAWHERHAAEYKEYGPDFTIPFGYELTSFRAVCPAPSVWDAWDYGNEIYSAGRRVALADDDHYIFRREPPSWDYTIRNGIPLTKFTPGDTIEYNIKDRNDPNKSRHIVLQMKTHGRLRLVMEDMVNTGNLVQFILKTTSFYDCQNIRKQLAGIQAIADMVAGGNAGGVPFEVYRSEQEITWNKPDGSAARVKKWFINIKADPDWVKFAFARLGKNALAGEKITQALIPATVSGTVDPAKEEFEDSDSYEPPDFLDGETKDVPAEAPAPAQETGNEPVFAYNSLDIVSAVSKRIGITRNEAAVHLANALKDGKIQKTMTIAQAETFASHLNV